MELKQMKNRDKTLGHFHELLHSIPQVRAAGRNSLDFKLWQERSDVVVRHAFGESSNQLLTFRAIYFGSYPQYPGVFERGLDDAEAKLKAMVMEVTEYWPIEPSAVAAKSATHTDVSDTNNRNVFVIHGHDEAARLELEKFLKQLDFDPVILGEKPSKGNTIIEKFNEYAAVSYAVALLTADDVGSPRRESTTRPRARQNVIFELGYFIGRLGRKRVCALTKGEPEIPSDYYGVVYVPMDSGEWKIDLAKELDEAGFDIDMNKLKQ